ncbi:MAG TPA: TonB-dependent receptor [Acidisarcina sp.]
MSRIRISPVLSLLLFVAVLATASLCSAQTFRGRINGNVTDQSGSVIPGAQVQALETATNNSLKTVTSSAGEFVFTEIPLGDYTITVSAAGFSSETVKGVTVGASAPYTLPVKLSIASAGQTIEVTADAITLDTVTDTQSTVLPERVVQNLPNSARDFTQMLAQAPGFAGFSTGGGAGNASVNGTRSNSVNWQIEGTDNNDLWWNIPAVNQGGVSAIAGVILPIDAIENFSFETSGDTGIGRNPGGTANLTIKSGTNSLHGSAYYFNHNEALQATNPFSTSKPATRNQNYGFSVGAPIWRDKLFFFIAGEHQNFLIGSQKSATEPTLPYVDEAYALLDSYGIPHNQVASNLLYGNGSLPGLYPTAVVNSEAPANQNNFTATGNLTGHSFNGIAKIDAQITAKDHVAATWFVGQGTQTAPTSSALAPYFENAPIHVQNYSLVYNRLVSNSVSNQLSMGVSYFNQVFSDADTNFNPVGLGLNTGVTDPSLKGSPHLIIGPSSASSGLSASGSGFDPTGVTAPSGRNDITGHLDEDLTWTKGAHQMHFGGEIRQGQVDDFYQTGKRGTLYFDGTQGPWSSSSTSCSALSTSTQPPPTSVRRQATGAPNDPNLLYLADFLAGCFDANASSIVEGDPKRAVTVNTSSLYGQDAWQVTSKLNLNYGVRYDYEGPVHSAYQDLSVFDPAITSGLAVAGVDVKNIYNKFWYGISPRVGFSWQVDPRTVLRGGYGFYTDTLYMKAVLQNNGVQNIAVFGPGLNPAGSKKVAQAPGLANTVIEPGQPIFESLASALAGEGIVKISTFDRNLRPSSTQIYDLNMQHSFSNSVVWQLGYVGTKGTHLLGMFDINPAAPGSLNSLDANGANTTRPYYGKFPGFSVIDEEKSNLGSIYHSLQTSLRIQGTHGVSSQLNYTWSHSMDYESGLLPYLPQNPYNEKAEFSNADWDVRNTFTGYVNYQVPGSRGPKLLTHGWEVNSGLTFHGGLPYTVTSSSNPSGNGENADRAVQVMQNPTAGVSHKIVNGAVQWFNPSAFVDAAPGTFSPTRRNVNYGPGYSAVDVAFLKTTPITERVGTQFRIDVFNIFNFINLAPLGEPFTGEGGQTGSTIGPYLGNPGIGPGEPTNAQVSLKIVF